MVKTIIEAQLRVSNMDGGNAVLNQTPRAICDALRDLVPFVQF